MPIAMILLVLLAAVLHASWNAVVKMSGDHFLTMATVMGTGGLMAATLLPWLPLPATESWIFLGLSTLIHLGYYFFLINAYRVGDLSHVYPLARGTAPLLVALGARVLVGERLGTVQFAGLLLVFGAILAFAVESARGAAWNPRPLLYGLGTAVFIAAYTVTDGIGVRRAGTPLSYIAWLFFIDGLPLLALAAVTRRTQIGSFLRINWRSGLAGGLMSALAYGLVIWALSLGPMAYVSALRETSVIFAALIGTRILHEPFGGRRILLAALVASGIVFMSLPQT